MNDHDPFDLVDLYTAVAELRATIGRTTVTCLACVAICELMVTPSAASVLALVLTAVALTVAVFALIELVECGSELVRLEQLVLWAGGAPCPA